MHPVTTTLDDLVENIQAARTELPCDRSLLVAISGIDGAGKGYVADQLAIALQQSGWQTVVINLDPWLHLPDHRFNPDHPGDHFYHHAFRFDDLFELLIQPLQRHRSVALEIELTGQSGQPRPYVYDLQDVDIILLEGIFLLKRSLLHHYDRTIWVECSYETALQRALHRNQENLPPDAIIHDYRTLYFPAQAVHQDRDRPQTIANYRYINDDAWSESAHAGLIP